MIIPLTPFSLNQPLAVDNSVSTIGCIHKMINKINNIIATINNLELDCNEYTDEQIQLLDSQLRSYINELNEITISHFESVERDILTNKGDIESIQSELNLLSDDFRTLSNSFDNLRIDVNNRITNSNSAMKSYVDLQIQIIKELIDAQNPVIIDCFGKPNKLQTAYNKLFDALMYSNGIGTFQKVLTKIMSFTFSPYVDMGNAQYYTVCTALASTPTNKYINYYLSYSNTSIQISTQNLVTFKDLITNIASCVIMLYKYGMYMSVPSGSTVDFQKALRISFFTTNEYQQVSFNPTFDGSLR